MMLELRVLGGARRGTVMRSEKSALLLGRHPACDLQLDPQADLDVSARHAEVRVVGERALLRDAGSRNGTLLNGVPVSDERELRDGDVIGLGVTGPKVQVRLVDAKRAARRGRGALVGAAAFAIVVVVAFVLTRGREQPAAAPAPRLAGAPVAAAPAALEGADFRSAAAASGRAVAYMVSELGGRPLGGTAFGVTAEGLLVTNRHLVKDGRAAASRVMVKFSDTDRWLRARVVATSELPDEDLALLQIEEPGSYPVVVAVHEGDPPEVGAPVATIGFPLADGTPMDSVGSAEVARSSLIAGTVSKRLARLLQIDSFAAHGSSGSPVLDARGRVVGVVYGGPKESGGRIVYAVPSGRVVEMMGRVKR